MEMICICGVNPRTRYKFNTKSQKSVIEELNQLASGQKFVTCREDYTERQWELLHKAMLKAERSGLVESTSIDIALNGRQEWNWIKK